MSIVSPVKRTPGDHATNVVHAHMRELIIEGVLPAGAVINQVSLASELGVSRTPVRDAIRMLQEEGLVEARPQLRARVAGFDPEHLETVYTQRVLLEGLAASITAPKADDEQIDRLENMLEALRCPPEDRVTAEWRSEHMRFHMELVSGVNPHFQAKIRANIDRGEHYRLNYRRMSEVNETRQWDTSPAEHRAIVDAFRERDGPTVASELANHLARTALTLVEQLSATYNPGVLRAALTTMTKTTR